MKKRLIYLLCFLVLLIIEFFIGAYVHDAFVRPYIGDVLVVLLIYFFIRIFIPRSLVWLPIYVFSFACFVEVLQYFQFADMLGLSGNGFARIILGSTFDWLDIVCYAIGCLLLWIAEWTSRRMERRKRASQAYLGYKRRTHWYL